MKAPAVVECLEEARLLVRRPRGVLSAAVLNKVLASVILQDGKFGRPFNRFADLTVSNAINLPFKYVFYFALYRRLARIGREPLKSAILVTSPEVARYVKLHARVTDRPPMKVRRFKEYGVGGCLVLNPTRDEPGEAVR